MTDSSPAPASAAPPTPQEPSCPNCGREATARSSRTERDVVTAYYVCDGEHLWSVRWVEGA